MRGSRFASALAFGACASVWPLASSAGADVVDPPGACRGSGQWLESGLDETSAEHDRGDLIVIPRTDTVAWSGAVGDAALGAEGPRRDISGEVQLDLPFGSVTIDDWGGSSVRYANEGTHEYDLPSILGGIEMRLHGAHRENGEEVCSGEVRVKVEGDAFDNPLAFAGLGGVAVSAVLLGLAGRARFTKVAPAFEDVNVG
jgi:hypothetical protein